MAAISASPLFLRDVLLTLKIGAGTVAEYQCHVSTAQVLVSPGDTVTVKTLCSDGVFSQPGAATYALALTAVQDWSADGLARALWDHEGEVADFVLQAHGETVPIGTDTPAMAGQVTLTPGNYGGEIETYGVMELELPCVSRPVLDIAP